MDIYSHSRYVVQVSGQTFYKVRDMFNGTTLGCLFFALGVIGLMITDNKQWLYLGFGIAVVLVVFQMVRDKRSKYKN